MTCGPDEYNRGDHCCKKCPKGTHVSSECNRTSETKCQSCSRGFYMNMVNYVDKCFQCKSCISSYHLEMSETCTNESDTKCKCMEGFYCTKTSSVLKNDCESCKAVSPCPPGHGVSVPHNSTHDAMCTPCPQGTFNNKTDYFTTCQNHTRCSDLGRELLSEGTAETDAKCGDFMTRCHWMVPAGLWAGLVLTILLVFIGFLCLRCKKRRRKVVITLESTQTFIPPALPPDVIKYPRSPESETHTHNSKPCAEEDDGGLDYEGLVCDGVTVLPEKCAAFSISDTCMSFISEPFRSEPQEDDWPVF
ncbi:hypothetical protein KOW79_000142 [Hemibagrus wyckioides]|uniref:TNFR-Cys domain-containing protein n=1 Tax=Hemibagrus wyckioides TaxID=337641 RepID=A0A9D3SXS1_9TELE|nr:tumor necrosis factor receptor superfamily member 5-like isoform X2 [Hemibagrus wyckioides]KAG7335449.1 hypothetical protein KOW79_000142 [Hemibagrus wyckioides]